jgi:uncharacterized protein (TIGR01244 family)
MKAKTRVSLVLGVVLAGTAAFLIAATCADIDKFNWIDDRVATGGQPLLEQLPALKREGFRTVINLREPSEYDEATESAEVRRLGLRYLSIPFRAADPKDEPVNEFLAAMKDKKVWPAFVHCGTGNRVGALWMIHRVVVDGWELENAEHEARLIGLKNPNLRAFAHEYICRHGKAEAHSIPCSNRIAGTN